MSTATPARKLSRVGVGVLASAFTIGIVSGGVMWRQGRNDPPRPPAGVATANLVHVVVAVVVVTLLLLLRRGAASGLREPFTDHWWRALTHTLRSPQRRPQLVPAVAVVIVLLVVVIFLVFRSGQQVLAGLNHNFTVDAWGGPSYVGAALAHWLDTALLFFVLTWLIGRITRAVSKLA